MLHSSIKCKINKINSILKNNEIEYEIIKLRDYEFLDIIDRHFEEFETLVRNLEFQKCQM